MNSFPEFEPSSDRMPAFLARYKADRDSVERLYTAPYSPLRRQHLSSFLKDWQEKLNVLPFEELTSGDCADWVLFRNLLESEQRSIEREAQRYAEMETLIPFAADLIALEDARRQLEEIDSTAIAERLARAATGLQEERKGLDTKIKAGERAELPRPTIANRAAKLLDDLREALGNWFTFYHGYDPIFTWWVTSPYRALETLLVEYAVFLREHLAGTKDTDTIIGEPTSFCRSALILKASGALAHYP